MKDDLMSKFKGDVVLVHSAFEYGKKLFGKDIKFYKNIIRRRKEETSDNSAMHRLPHTQS
jgi:hypothetical protein